MKYRDIFEIEKYISDKEMSMYTTGFCHVFAFALQDLLPDSDIVVVYDFDLDIESEVITHVLIKHGNLFMDITTITNDINVILDQYIDHGEQEVAINNNRSRITELPVIFGY